MFFFACHGAVCPACRGRAPHFLFFLLVALRGDAAAMGAGRGDGGHDAAGRDARVPAARAIRGDCQHLRAQGGAVAGAREA